MQTAAIVQSAAGLKSTLLTQRRSARAPAVHIKGQHVRLECRAQKNEAEVKITLKGIAEVYLSCYLLCVFRAVIAHPL